MSKSSRDLAIEPVPVATLDRRLSHLRLAAPVEVARLRRSIARDGVRHPVLVSTAIAAEKLVLVDGHKRARILEELGIETVPATKLALEEPAALVAMVTSNASHRGLCDVEEAWIVRALCRTNGLKQTQIAQLLSRDKSWVCRRLKLAEKLETSIVDDIRLGLLPSSVGREIARLPRGQQLGTTRAIHAHGLTSRQTAKLVSLLLETPDPAERRALLSDPLTGVAPSSAAAHAALDLRLNSAGRRLRAALVSFAESSQRLEGVVNRHAPVGLDAAERHALAPLLATALALAGSVRAQLERLDAPGEPSQPGA